MFEFADDGLKKIVEANPQRHEDTRIDMNIDYKFFMDSYTTLAFLYIILDFF